MHDPVTVAFDFLGIVIWHVDPERDGSDDSCGWSYPRLTGQQWSMMEHLAYCESETPWFQRDPVKRIDSAADAESLVRGALQMVAYCLKQKLSWNELCELACRLTHNSADNFQGSLCHLPGWHTNFKEDLVDERKRNAAGFFCSVARIILQRKRRWWKHPRWHFRHWKIQIGFVLKLKRWMFSKCSVCGKRFRWGVSPVSNNWNGTGPLWFRSERDVMHMECDRTVLPDVEVQEVKP